MSGLLPPSIHPNRKYGQNFLVDEAVLDRLVRAAEVTRHDVVVEIGPGTGNVTSLLVREAGRVVAVEIDRQFTAPLEALASRSGNLEVVWGDATKIELPPCDKVVAALPYKQALPLIFDILANEFEIAVVIVQRDLARRLAAKPGEPGYSRVTVCAQRSAEVEMLEMVPKECYRPPPRVESAVLRLTPRRRPVAVPSEEFFRNLLDSFFLHRNRTVAEVLRHSIGSARLATITSELSPSIRRSSVRDVSPREFGRIAWVLHRNGVTTKPVPEDRKRQAQRIRCRR